MRSLLLIILFPLLGFSQDYQVIRSNQINYFSPDNLDRYFATRTDSVVLDGSDSIFYSYKTLRYNDTSTVWFCNYLRSSNWYGSKVIIKNNGENIFFNAHEDTIRFQTHAVLNDTFEVYKYPSGKTIKGWVSNTDTMTVLGVQDSVKYIQLFSTDTTIIFQDSVFLIGKNYGFIQLFPFYSFPALYSYGGAPMGIDVYQVNQMALLVGTEFPRKGVTKLKKSEIYNFSIGDEVKWNRNTIHWSPGPYWEKYYKEMKFTDVQDFGLDSLFLEYEYAYQNEIIPQGYPVQISSGSNIYGYMVYGLDDYLYEILPEELTDPGRVGFLQLSSCGRLVEGYVQSDIIPDEADSLGNMLPTAVCFFSDGMGMNSKKYEYYEGLGGPYFLNGETYNGFGQSHSGSISYFNAQGESCGTNWYVGLPESIDPIINLYPNPTTGKFTIDLMKADQGNLKITDMSGKLLKSDQIDQEQTIVDVSDLPAGVYLVVVEIDGQRYQKKLIKN